MIRVKQDQEDLVWLAVDRSNAANVTEAIRINGNTGAVLIGGVVNGVAVATAAFTQTYATALATVTAALVDSTGGTPSGTLAAGITDTVAKNAIASLAADNLAIKKVVNALINACRAKGIVL